LHIELTESTNINNTVSGHSKSINWQLPEGRTNQRWPPLITVTIEKYNQQCC